MAKLSEQPEDDSQALKTYVKLMRAAAGVTERMHKHLMPEKLTLSQFGVLEALYHLGPLCQQDIGKKILKTSGNMTTVIDNLEKRGLVVRAHDPSDRRFKRVRLTAQGENLIKKIFPRHIEIAEHVFSTLSPQERTQLSVLLKRLGTADG
jgi:MarR family 2-MHQ and catechol resistance regulon transcriptional repressor